MMRELETCTIWVSILTSQMRSSLPGRSRETWRREAIRSSLSRPLLQQGSTILMHSLIPRRSTPMSYCRYAQFAPLVLLYLTTASLYHICSIAFACTEGLEKSCTNRRHILCSIPDLSETRGPLLRKVYNLYSAKTLKGQYLFLI